MIDMEHKACQMFSFNF